MTNSLKAALIVGIAIATPAAALAQRTGVSHPDEIPVTTSPEGIAQPIVYDAPAGSAAVRAGSAPAAPALKVRPAEPVLTASTASPTVEGEAAASPRDTDRMPPVKAYDPDANIVTRVPGPANQLPIGAMLHATLQETVSTQKTVEGTSFTAVLREPVERDGRVLLPAGSLLHGKVTEVHGGRRISGSAAIHLQPLSVTLPDGTRYGVRAQVIDTGLSRRVKVDDEGTILRSDHAKGTLAAVGLSTGSGAAAGAVFGGWPGALIGAGVGAGVSTVVWLKQDRQTEMPAGTEITFALTGPLAVGLQ